MVLACSRNSCLVELPASTGPGLGWGNDSDHRPPTAQYRTLGLCTVSPTAIEFSFVSLLVLGRPSAFQHHRPNQPLLPALSGRSTRVEEPGTDGRRQRHPSHQPCGAERNAVQPCNRLFPSRNCNSLKDDASPYLHFTRCLLLRYLRTSCKILPGLKDVSLLFRVVGLVVSGSIYRLEDPCQSFLPSVVVPAARRPPKSMKPICNLALPPISTQHPRVHLPAGFNLRFDSYGDESSTTRDGSSPQCH